jgi:hypothetical protein
VLEKLSSYLKNFKHFRMVPKDVWNFLVTIKFEYNPDSNVKAKELTKEEQEIDRLRKLKSKDKLSKRKQHELIDLERAESKKLEKKKLSVEDKRIQKVLKKELKESEAIVDDRSKQRLGKQILLKLFYLTFKLIREFPREACFEPAVQSLMKHLVLADIGFVSDVLEELQNTYKTFASYDSSKDKDGSFLKKQVLVIGAILEISQQYSKLNRRNHGRGGNLRRQLFLRTITDPAQGPVTRLGHERSVPRNAVWFGREALAQKKADQR